MMRLRLPLLLLVFAATAIPVELRPLDAAAVDLDSDMADIVANVAGYIPVGLVLAVSGTLPALIISGLVSSLAEVAQFFMANRFPSPIDTASNLAGAAIGVFLATRGHIQASAIKLDKRTTAIALALALAVVGLGVWTISRERTNSRGVVSAGILEADWRFDETGGDWITDSSSSGLQGRLVHGAALVAGRKGNAVRLDGEDDYINLRNPLALRLAGSMTAVAWVNSKAFPVDDAVIIANRDGRPDGTNAGFQLDTNVESGFRSIGFSLMDRSGSRVYRSGATRLSLDTWYHVAGVFDASTRMIDLYLNGEPDNGPLIRVVPNCQVSPNQNASIGRLPGRPGYEFAGLIDEVRIYSRALTPAEIRSDMNGTVVNTTFNQEVNGSSESLQPVDDSCRRSASLGGPAMPGITAGFGVLVATALAGFWWPRSYCRIACLVVSLAAGVLFLSGTASILPAHYLWLMPLLTIGGGASVAVSLIDPRGERSAPLASHNAT